MQTRTHNPFTTIHTEGALLPTDLLQRVLANDPKLEGLTPNDYHLTGSEKLNEAINRSWNRLQGSWATFRTSQGRLSEGDAGTTLTRERWLLPLFQELGYGRLQTSKAIELEGKSYPISHKWGDTPIHLVGCGIELDKRTAGAAGASRSSPHSLLQELLNRAPEYLWGLVSNGLRLRVLRDNASLTRQAFLEFDLESMFEGEVYSDFAVLWLICHESRFESPLPSLGEGSGVRACWLETWSKAAQEQGTRALDSLRQGVEGAISALGSGFLRHPANQKLRTDLRSGTLSTQDYYRQLLRLVYRLIFLFVAEDRDLLFDPASSPQARARYLRYYSLGRLRRLAERSRGGRHPDLYIALKLVSGLLGARSSASDKWPMDENHSPLAAHHSLGLFVMGGFLFAGEALQDLEASELDNESLLAAIRCLIFLDEGRQRRAVDYKNLGSEELGSIYESLLELHPLVNTDAATFELTSVSGSERKTTGSYYTPSSLIQVLLDSALDPVIEQAEKSARRMANGEWENPQEETYAYSVVSGIGSLEKGHGFSRENLSVDKSLPNPGTVRSDLPDAPGGGLSSGEHRGGLGQNRDEGVSTLSANRSGKFAGTGNPLDSESESGSLQTGTNHTPLGNDNDSGQANPVSNEKFGAANGEIADSEWLRVSSEWKKTPLAIRHSLLAERSLLNLKICDPACGSGHFLVAASHRLARRLATVRTGEGEPAPEALRSALRSVISNCIYGVDINPMSVELCKVSLWMEALEPGKPLSFLDAHIQCGDSLVGVSPNLDISEIPDEAFNPAFGDDKATSSALKKRNKAERGGQMGLDMFVVRDEEDLQAWMAQRAQSLDTLPEETVEQVGQKTHSYHEYLASPQYQHRKLEYDMWTAAFFWKMEALGGASGILAPTQEMLRWARSGGTLPPELARHVNEMAERLNFLHWELRFPKVFTDDNPGFDVVLGNPPWEMVQLDPKEFFAKSAPHIVDALNMAARDKLIAILAKDEPELLNSYHLAIHDTESQQKFIHESKRFPLTSYGRINLMALFAELTLQLIQKIGRSGIVIPTGIATDTFNQKFFADLTKKHRLIQLIGFENEEFLFPGIANVIRFCLFVTGGQDINTETPVFAYYLRRYSQLGEKERFFELSLSDLRQINPNTGLSPIFRTKTDLLLTKKIYSRFPIIDNEITGENPWGFKGSLMFMMNSDSKNFSTEPFENSLPLYEGKFFWHFDHRFSSWDMKGKIKGKGGRGLPETPIDLYIDPHYSSKTQYWVSTAEVDKRLPVEWKFNWLITYRDIASAKLERTMVASIIPKAGAGDTSPLMFINNSYIPLVPCLLGNLNSLVFDYAARQKIGGTHLRLGYAKQFAILPPSIFTPTDIAYIAPRVLELVYTAYDLRPFAEDMGYHGEPFRWDEVRRAQLRAELDAYYARLYGLTRDELRYILDPKEVYGEDFPGETFRVLKDKEIRLYGEFRTRRLVLEAWDKLETNGEWRTENREWRMANSEKQSASSLLPMAANHSPLATRSFSEPSVSEPAKSEPRKEPEPVEENPEQPMLSDFGLYKCQVCGKMVMGYEKEKHAKDKHGGKSVEWRKLK